MNDLKSIRTFLQVVRCGSFAGAARQMGSTPTSVTRAVAALERGLGVQLLLRTTRSVSLTAAGEVYALRMTPILEEIDRTTAEISAGGAPASGRIRLTAPMSFGLRVLPSLLAQFRAAHPSIDIQAVLSDEFLDIVGAGYDVAVRISRPPTDKSTIWRKLCLIERVL
ncbi:MAG: LysR family transcriptional regulator, partial [Pseudomonadota bacterium]